MEYYLFTVVYLCLATNGVHQQIHLLAIAQAIQQELF